MENQYDKINWTNDTPLSVSNLDHMDTGIEQAHNRLDNLHENLDYAVTQIDTNISIFNLVKIGDNNNG